MHSLLRLSLNYQLKSNKLLLFRRCITFCYSKHSYSLRKVFLVFITAELLPVERKICFSTGTTLLGVLYLRYNN